METGHQSMHWSMLQRRQRGSHRCWRTVSKWQRSVWTTWTLAQSSGSSRSPCMPENVTDSCVREQRIGVVVASQTPWSGWWNNWRILTKVSQRTWECYPVVGLPDKWNTEPPVSESPENWVPQWNLSTSVKGWNVEHVHIDFPVISGQWCKTMTERNNSIPGYDVLRSVHLHVFKRSLTTKTRNTTNGKFLSVPVILLLVHCE